jgi:NAD(P)-dependent dehydrogenase (short-subunit alcohol dehydrogenase family)
MAPRPSSDDQTLDGDTAANEPRSMLVTGGAQGLGLAIALAALDAGYRVGIIDVAPPPADVAPVDVPLGDVPPGDWSVFQASVSDEQAVDAVLDEFGTPTVVVNNAGIVRFGPLLDLAVDDVRAVLDVNLVGTFVVSRAVARRWVADGRPGVIVNVTSMNGVAAGPNAGAYGPSKAAVGLLTSQMALEWGSRGIRVNAVAPGLIDAGMSEPIYADADTRAARISKVPLGRLGTARDIADVVLFLASGRSAYIHGQNILVDGGVTGSVIAHLPRPQSVDAVGHRP